MPSELHCFKLAAAGLLAERPPGLASLIDCMLAILCSEKYWRQPAHRQPCSSVDTVSLLSCPSSTSPADRASMCCRRIHIRLSCPDARFAALRWVKSTNLSSGMRHTRMRQLYLLELVYHLRRLT
jgi:hypothetical protein